MKVTVILATYNGSRYLARAIGSVLAQSFVDYEFLIIDDGSTDKTAAMVRDFSRQDKRIRYLRHEYNQGLVEAINHGLHRARGQYIALIDDDDFWIDTDKLTKQVEFLDRNPDHVLVGMGHIYVDEAGNELCRYSPAETDPQIRKELLVTNVFAQSVIMFRRDTAIQVGGGTKAQNIFTVLDYDLCLKMGTRGKLANLPDYGFVYTVREGSISSLHKVTQLRESLQLAVKYRKYYDNYYYAVFRRSLELFIYGIMNVSPYSKYKINLGKLIRKILSSCTTKSHSFSRPRDKNNPAF